MSPYEYSYGVKPTGGLTNLPLDAKLLASLTKEEDLKRALEIPQNQLIEIYTQDKSKTANIPVLADENEDINEFHLFNSADCFLDLVAGDLEEFILPDEVEAEKVAIKALLHIEYLEDGRGKAPAKEASMNVTNAEQATNDELADILLEEYGGEEVEAEVEKDEDEESTEVEDDEVEDKGTDALLSPNRGKRKEAWHMTTLISMPKKYETSRKVVKHPSLEM